MHRVEKKSSRAEQAGRLIFLPAKEREARSVHNHRNRLHASDGFDDAVFFDTRDDVIGALVVRGILLDDF